MCVFFFFFCGELKWAGALDSEPELQIPWITTSRIREKYDNVTGKGLDFERAQELERRARHQQDDSDEELRRRLNQVRVISPKKTPAGLLFLFYFFDTFVERCRIFFFYMGFSC